MNTGYIKIHRKICEWEWYANSNVMRVFFHCLIKANHREKKWQGIVIERGSFVTSYDKLAKDLHLSIQQIRTSINKLKTTGELTVKTTNKYSIIYIKNYNNYQENSTQSNKQITIKQQTNNKQITTTNNEKNENNDKNNINISKKETISSILKSINNENLRNTLKDFVEYRKSYSLKFTVGALKLILTELDKLTKDDYIKIKILEQSIINGWKGVFPLKQNKSFNNGRVETSPCWMGEHQKYSDEQSKKQQEQQKEVDRKKLIKLLNSFKEVKDV